MGFNKKKSYNKALLLKNTNAIHTFGMKMDIDVLYLDKCYGLIDHIVNIKPNKILMPIKGAKHVIEIDSKILITKSDYINARIVKK